MSNIRTPRNRLPVAALALAVLSVLTLAPAAMAGGTCHRSYAHRPAHGHVGIHVSYGRPYAYRSHVHSYRSHYRPYYARPYYRTYSRSYTVCRPSYRVHRHHHHHYRRHH